MLDLLGRLLSSALLIAVITYPASVIGQEDTEEPAAATTDNKAAATDTLSELAASLPANQLRWLDSEYGRFLGVYLQESAGNPKGAVIIVPDLNRHPVWPKTIEGLQHFLSDNGWHTLAIAMPPTPEIKPPARSPGISTTTEESELTGEEQTSNSPPSDTANKDDFENQAHAHITAAIQFLNNEGIFNLVMVGEGIGAIRVARYAQSIPASGDNEGASWQLRALAFINPHNQINGTDFTLVEAIPDIATPMLDLVSGHDSRDLREAFDRKRASKSLPAKQYVQVLMPVVEPPQQGKGDRLSRRVRGWIDKTSTGVAIGLGSKKP